MCERRSEDEISFHDDLDKWRPWCDSKQCVGLLLDLRSDVRVVEDGSLSDLTIASSPVERDGRCAGRLLYFD